MELVKYANSLNMRAPLPSPRTMGLMPGLVAVQSMDSLSWKAGFTQQQAHEVLYSVP
jgi:hypothetical protein